MPDAHGLGDVGGQPLALAEGPDVAADDAGAAEAEDREVGDALARRRVKPPAD
jgi:hypothetical protein